MREGRKVWVKVRASQAERAEWHAKAAGIKRPLWKFAERRKATVPSLEPDPPDCQEDQAAQKDQNGGRQVVPKDQPAVKPGGMIGHEIEQRIFFEQGEGPVDESPGGPSPGPRESRIG